MWARLVIWAAFFAVMIPLALVLHWIVYDVLPVSVAGYLGVAGWFLALGYLLGSRQRENAGSGR